MIKLYKLDGCPRCEILADKLKTAKIPFEETENWEPIECLGFSSAPVLQVEDKFLNYSEAIRWVIELKGLI
jgi:hypothetical protein